MLYYRIGLALGGICCILIVAMSGAALYGFQINDVMVIGLAIGGAVGGLAEGQRKPPLSRIPLDGLLLGLRDGSNKLLISMTLGLPVLLFLGIVFLSGFGA